jgi:hypothetical protein
LVCSDTQIFKSFSDGTLVRASSISGGPSIKQGAGAVVGPPAVNAGPLTPRRSSRDKATLRLGRERECVRERVCVRERERECVSVRMLGLGLGLDHDYTTHCKITHLFSSAE